MATSYTVEKKMKSTFDFGYKATIDLKNQDVKALVYDKDDDDMFVMSFLVCDFPEIPGVNPVVYVTGVKCRRSTCFGIEVIETFEDGNMGEHILREMDGVFEKAYPNAELRLYSEDDFKNTCKVAQDYALEMSCVLANTALPTNAVLDIAKRMVPSWTRYKHEPDVIRNKLSTEFIEYIGNPGPLHDDTLF